MAQCAVHALKGLACRARVTPASSPASHCKHGSVALQAVLSPHVAFASRARLRQSFSRTLRSQKTKYFLQWVQTLGTPRYMASTRIRGEPVRGRQTSTNIIVCSRGGACAKRTGDAASVRHELARAILPEWLARGSASPLYTLCFANFCTTGYLSFGPTAQCVVHALKGLACRARVTPVSSPASHCKQCSALTSPALHAHGCASPSCACLGSQKHNILFNGPKLGYPTGTLSVAMPFKLFPPCFPGHSSFKLNYSHAHQKCFVLTMQR